MNLRILAFGFACLALTFAAAPQAAAQLPGELPKTPFEKFRAARDRILEGKFTLAADQLKDFLAAGPTDKDFLDLEAKFGVTVFDKLRLVPSWSDNPEVNASALKTVDEIIAKDREARAKLYKDPARIAKFVRNLGATTEERIYAETQLLPSGDSVVVPMVEALLTTTDKAWQAGILGAVNRLGAEVVPGFLASLEGLPEELKGSMLSAIVTRQDIHNLASNAETDPRPWLWYYAGANDSPAVQGVAKDLLRRAVGPIEKRAPDAELVALARPFYLREGRFASFDMVGNKVKVWTWDAGKRQPITTDATKPQAEEYYGLRALRWAQERNPKNVAAQELFLTFATERAVERSKFGVLMVSEPPAYQLLAAAPSEMLIRLLEQALAEKKTALAFALTQGLADRAEKAATHPTEITTATGGKALKPAVLGKALEYPDPRVQLAAAIGLMRVPGPPLHGKAGRVVEILTQAAGAEPPAAGTTSKGRAIVADPNDIRADNVREYLTDLGYVTERVKTGRDLLRRVGRATDLDLVIVDRHVVDPLVSDLVPQLKSNPHLAGRPILVVASPDKPISVPLEQLLLRVAAIVALTETDEPVVTPPFAIDPRKPLPEDVEKAKRDNRVARDGELDGLFRNRLARLERIVDAANLPRNQRLEDRLKLRLPQLTYAILATQYPITLESAPETYRRLQSLTNLIRSRPELSTSTTNVPAAGLNRLIEEMGSAINPELQAKIDQLRRRFDVSALLLPTDVYRDSRLEDTLSKMVAGIPNARVVPEPYSTIALELDLAAVAQDASLQPRDPAQKKLAAQYAVDYLRKIALGELTGYDVRPAESALRAALKDDDLAEPAADALSRIPTAAVQQDLFNVAIATNRPPAVRLRAADRTMLHIQAFGKLIPATQSAGLPDVAANEKVGDLKGKLLNLQQLLLGTPDEIGSLIPKYPSPLAPPPEPKKE